MSSSARGDTQNVIARLADRRNQSDAASQQTGDACGRHCDAEAILDPADRDFRIDLFRGLALWWIFLDHVPETYLNHFTPKNFGFSDAAEILVFLSGLASGSVYGGVIDRSGTLAALFRALRRAFEIYAAQVVTVILLLGEISLLAIWQPNLMDHANLAVFVAAPVSRCA